MEEYSSYVHETLGSIPNSSSVIQFLSKMNKTRMFLRTFKNWVQVVHISLTDYENCYLQIAKFTMKL